MFTWLSKHRIWVITAALITLSSTTPPLAGDYADEDLNLILPLATGFGLPLFYAFLTKELFHSEKWILPTLFGMMSLMITGLSYDHFLDAFNLYRDDGIYIDVKNVFLANIIFYATSVYSSLFGIELYNQYHIHQR